MSLSCIIAVTRPWLHQIGEGLDIYLLGVTPPPVFIKKRGWCKDGPDRRAHNQPALPVRVELIRRGHRHW